MRKDFQQTTWDATLQQEWLELVRLAIQEDFGKLGDLTTAALVPPGVEGRAALVARGPGVLAGVPAVHSALPEIDARLRAAPCAQDGDVLVAGQTIAWLSGPAASLLQGERLILNVLGRLSGIATLTRRYVDAVAGTKARIYDTRKTTPAWRRLEKYAVRCGGGCNHRTGLYDGVLIKDNHLAIGAAVAGADALRYGPGEAVRRARRYLEQQHPETAGRGMIVEVEVDRLLQLDEVFPAGPDIVLLDNMSPAELREAVARRDAGFPHVELEASGGIDLQTVRAVALTGVDRISVGALTHSAVCLDIGLDWTGDGV